MKATTMKIARAKRSRLGRLACRLLGDERGAVMMEYVMIAVLVAAAAVAIFMVFGRSIRDKANAMVGAMDGDPAKAAEELERERGLRMGETVDAMKTGDTFDNLSGQ